MYTDLSGQGIRTWIKNRWDDIKRTTKKAYEYVTNNSETVVLNAKHLAFYEGRLVVKLPMGRNAASFGIMFIGDGIISNDDVKHEYGHTK